MTFHTHGPDSERNAASASDPLPQSSTGDGATGRCSLCNQPFDRSASRSLPFCSPRCREIDLGNWLNESYGLPVDSPDGELIDDEPENE